MAITASFSVSQNATSPQNVVITDTSTGSYDTIVGRRVYVQNSDGEYLTGNGSVNYDNWLLANLSITLSILSASTACNIKVDWVDISGNVVNSVNANYGLSQFSKQFFFYLIQQQGLNPGTYQDTTYSSNIALFWSNVIGGDNAITYGNDLAGAQQCYDRANQMEENESYYF